MISPPRYRARHRNNIPEHIPEYGIWDTFTYNFVEFQTWRSQEAAEREANKMNRAYEGFVS